MRHLRLITLLAAILSFGLSLGAAPDPAEAGRACKRLKLGNNCIKSSDINPNINIGKRGNDGDVRIKDRSNRTAVTIDGDKASVSNRFINSTSTSQGLVKAWAMINADGTVFACFRCSKSAAQTGKLVGSGQYEVDFTPLSTSITNRPRTAVIDDHIAGNATSGFIDLNDRGGDFSSVFVNTADTNGLNSDRPFLLIIF